MADINEYNVHSGRVLNEASTAINIADSTGATTDAAVINPAAAASIIAALKGIISLLVGGGGGVAVTIADGDDITQGAKADVAVTDPTAVTTTIAALKGILTDLGILTSSAVVDPTASANINALLKGIMTDIGPVAATAVADPAASASIVAALKGLLTLIGSLTATAVIDPTASGGINANIKGLLKQLQGTGTGNTPVRFVPRTTQVGTDQTVTWAASSVINTQKNIDIALPTSPCNIYQAICLNPSRVSDIAVDVKIAEPTFIGETRRIKLTSFNVAKATAFQLFNDESAPFVTAQGANVTCSTDAAVYKVGTHSAKLAVGDGAATGLLASVATTGTYNLSIYSHLWFWVYSSVALDAGDLTMSVDNTAACASPIETINIPAIAATTWTKLYIPMVDPTLCTAIVSLGINMAVDKGALDIYFDDVSGFKPGSESPLIEGLYNGVAARFSLQNSTALGATDDFSSYLRLKEYR